MLDSIKGFGKEKYTLLDFVVMNVRSLESSLLNFHNDFAYLEDVLQIDLTEVESKIKDFENGINKINKEKESLIKENNNINEKFVNFLDDLHKNASDKLNQIKSIQESFNKDLVDLSVYFGEDPKQIKLFEFIKIINDFVTNFKNKSAKFSAEEAKQLKKKIKEDAKFVGMSSLAKALLEARKKKQEEQIPMKS